MYVCLCYEAKSILNFKLSSEIYIYKLKNEKIFQNYNIYEKIKLWYEVPICFSELASGEMELEVQK